SKTLDLAKATVDQLAGQVDRTILLDNTDDGALAELANDQVDVLHMPGAGIHEMWNKGCQAALDHANQRRNVNLLVLNDDLEFGPRFTRRLVEALRSDPDLAAVSANYDGRTSVDLVEVVDDICAGR